MSRKTNEQTKVIHVRVTLKEKDLLESQVRKYNFRTMSDFIRFIALNTWEIKIHRDCK
jgi:Arc/MetJ-type ribon-helix-helix transcriptional regulator